MRYPPERLGRIVGLLLLGQFVVAVVFNVALLGPVISQPPGWIVNAAAQPLSVSISVVLALVADAIWLAIAVVAYPLFAHASLRTAVAFVALTCVALALSAVENGHLLTLRSLSQAYATAGTADRELFETLRVLFGSARNWAHYTHLMVTGISILAFFAALFRFLLVPRALAVFGGASAGLQIVTVTMPIFGQPVIFAMLAPLGLAIVSLAAWLLVKGFSAPRLPNQGFRTGDDP
jgi:Domain of unknown function (DUF4386)